MSKYCFFRIKGDRLDLFIKLGDFLPNMITHFSVFFLKMLFGSGIIEAQMSVNFIFFTKRRQNQQKCRDRGIPWKSSRKSTILK
jgi:hypothetical protein